MKLSYKTMTDCEYRALGKLIDRTGNDCWASIRQDKNGVDYIYDWENKKRMCLKTGVTIMAEILDHAQEVFDNCHLEWNERVALKQLFDKLGIVCDVDFRIPQFVGMPLCDFLSLLSDTNVKAKRDGDDYGVDDTIYQFDTSDVCFSVVQNLFVGEM